MAYTRPIRWEPGTFLRPCDICGIRFRANELVRSADGKFRCMRWCAEQTQLERDRISSASDKRREAPPPPFGAPYLFKDSYNQEGILFNFLANQGVADSGWPGGRRQGAAPGVVFRSLGYAQAAQGTYSAISAGETMRYLYGLIVENKRPTLWLTRAVVKLRELADWVISRQAGVGAATFVTKSNSILYGSYISGSLYSTADNGCLGMGMVLAYKVLGEIKYLSSARAFADFLTNLQQGGILTAGFSSSDAAGTTPVGYGTWTKSTNALGTSFDHVYQPDSLACLEFLSVLSGVTGDELHGADTTLSGQFTIAPQQLLSVSMANARAFWSVGAFDVVTSTTLTGLSSTTPREYFNSYPVAKGLFAAGTGSWQYQDGPSATGTLVTAVNFAIALRALMSFEGYSATVATLWTWLMGFASNPAFAPTSTSLAQDIPTELSLTGSYNPKLTLSTLLQVRTAALAASAMNGSSVYDWRCSGLMSSIQGVQDPGSLDLAKDYVTKGVTALPPDFSAGSNGTDYLMMQGVSGLGGQIVNAS